MVWVNLKIPEEANGGSMSRLTEKLARLGNSGKYPNNIERDLYRVLHLPITPYYVEVPIWCQSNRRDIKTKRIPILLPHELYHYLFEPCHEMERLKSISFWRGKLVNVYAPLRSYMLRTVES